MGSMSDTRKEIAERLGFAADATRPGAKAKFGLERLLSIDLDEADIRHYWQNGYLYVYSSEDAEAAKEVIKYGNTVNTPSIPAVVAKVRVQASRPGAKAAFGDVGSDDNKIRYLLGEAESAIRHGATESVWREFVERAESLVQDKTPVSLRDRIKRVKASMSRHGAKAKFAISVEEAQQRVRDAIKELRQAEIARDRSASSQNRSAVSKAKQNLEDAGKQFDEALAALKASRPGAKAKMAAQKVARFRVGKDLSGGYSVVPMKADGSVETSVYEEIGFRHSFPTADAALAKAKQMQAKYGGTITMEDKQVSSRPGAKAAFAADAREVGNEILRQLGGGRFMAMVGGKNAMYGMFGGKPGLQVSIGKGAEGGINRVIITLDRATDTYRMEFWKIAKGGLSTQKVSEASMVYADDLQRVFTDRTKFYTSMSRPGAKARFGTNKRIIRYAGHEFLAEDEGNRTRISIKVDGAWEHATTVNTDNQTATEWIEANAKPGNPSRWLPSAYSRPGAKAK